jgi:hypothetical protein
MLDKIFGGGTIKEVAGLIDDVFTSDEEKANAKIAIEKIQARLKEKQLEINKAEASHRSLFVAGWRPCLGWISALSIGYVYLFQPFIVMILKITGSDVVLPNLDLSQLMPLVLGMLGLGGLRTFEKTKGITK